MNRKALLVGAIVLAAVGVAGIVFGFVNMPEAWATPSFTLPASSDKDINMGPCGSCPTIIMLMVLVSGLVLAKRVI